MKRFGWGSPDRAVEALKRTFAESRQRVGNIPLPVIVVGAGRGGKLGLEVAARTPGLFSAVGSVGGTSIRAGGRGGRHGLKGVPVFLGVARGLLRSSTRRCSAGARAWRSSASG